MKRVALLSVVSLLSLAFADGTTGNKAPSFENTAMGVNLAGAEFGSTYPGIYGQDYAYPRVDSLNYYRCKGLMLIRLPFLWERMQPVLHGSLDPIELDRMKVFVAEAQSKGMKVILDAHDYGRYGKGTFTDVTTHGQIIGAPEVPVSAFKGFWTAIASQFVGNPAIYGYDIMNEPHDMGGVEVWPAAAQAAIDGIRSVDQGTRIIVEGDHWSNAATWPAANEALEVSDPANHLIYEAHAYFDHDESGNYRRTYDQEGAYPAIGADRLQPFIEWLDQHHAQGFVGEYAVPDNDPRWLAVLDKFLAALKEAHLMGLYWAGGPKEWASPIALEPIGGRDRPQIAVLERYSKRDAQFCEP
jgi:endoglucanase